MIGAFLSTSKKLIALDVELGAYPSPIAISVKNSSLGTSTISLPSYFSIVNETSPLYSL